MFHKSEIDKKAWEIIRRNGGKYTSMAEVREQAVRELMAQRYTGSK